MKTVKLLIASSLDGYIAGPDGNTNWLTPFERVEYGYNEFVDTIDITLMGHTTYRQVLTFGEFPYKDKTNYVFTRKPGVPEAPNVQFVMGDAAMFVQKLKQQDGPGIWLIGGGQLNSALLAEGLIDEMILFIIPVIIGQGIPLFQPVDGQSNWTLVSTKQLDMGMVQLNYLKS